MNVSFRKRAGRAPAPVRAATTAGALTLAFASLVTVGASSAAGDAVTDTSVESDISSEGYDHDAVHGPHGQNGWRNTVRAEQRGRFEIIGDGEGVHWLDIDEDISAEGMLHGTPARRPKQPI